LQSLDGILIDFTCNPTLLLAVTTYIVTVKLCLRAIIGNTLGYLQVCYRGCLLGMLRGSILGNSGDSNLLSIGDHQDINSWDKLPGMMSGCGRVGKSWGRCIGT